MAELGARLSCLLDTCFAAGFACVVTALLAGWVGTILACGILLVLWVGKLAPVAKIALAALKAAAELLLVLLGTRLRLG